MQVHINHKQAQGILAKCLQNKTATAGELEPLINQVIFGSHKTYKYVLLTGLLAKATNEDANPIALQAGAPIDGAYDARSLCHKVLVPFERDLLSNALGGSNEPFLNKPARFTHLSTHNAVRGGDDKKTLDALILILTNTKTSNNALQCLSFILKALNKVIANNALLQTIQNLITPDLIDIYAFVTRLVERSIEGETCAIVVGAIEKQFYTCLKGHYRVLAHKVNQSGASSKEIGDIDIYSDDKYFYSIEIKDKAFTVYDLEHAFNKIIENGGKKGGFIYGPRATFDQESIKIKLYSYEQKKFITMFLGILTYAKMMLFQTPNMNLTSFIQLVMDTAIEINSKEETKLWIHEVHNETMPRQ